MNSVNPQGGFPFYESKDLQAYRQEWSAGEEPTGIMATTTQMPSFCLVRVGASVTIDAFKLYDENDTLQETLDTNLIEKQCTESGEAFAIFDGVLNQTLPCGAYRYVEIDFNGVLYYSELFRVEIE